MGLTSSKFCGNRSTPWHMQRKVFSSARLAEFSLKVQQPRNPLPFLCNVQVHFKRLHIHDIYRNYLIILKLCLDLHIHIDLWRRACTSNVSVRVLPHIFIDILDSATENQHQFKDLKIKVHIRISVQKRCINSRFLGRIFVCVCVTFELKVNYYWIPHLQFSCHLKILSKQKIFSLKQFRVNIMLC